MAQTITRSIEELLRAIGGALAPQPAPIPVRVDDRRAPPRR